MHARDKACDALMSDRYAPAAREYHERTKLFSGASKARRVDSGLIPKQYKRYLHLPSVPLPPPTRSTRSLFDVLPGLEGPVRPLSLPDLASVLHFSAGIIRRSDGESGPAFRAASCTGALYHVELYVVCGDIDDAVPAGVYHYDVFSESLRPLRTGDHRGALAAACCDEAVGTSGASIVLTSTFWRNAWRYEERAYRHVFWDAGTLLANLLAVAESHELLPVLRSAFVDAEVNSLLGVDSRREAAVAVVSLGAETAGSAGLEDAGQDLSTEPLSRAEIEYPLIWQTHEATSLAACEDVQAWRQQTGPSSSRPSPVLIPGALPLEESIERRVSARRFSEDPLSYGAFSSVLTAAKGSLRNDHAYASPLCRPMLIVRRVEGLEPGLYTLDRSGAPSLFRAGDFTDEAAHLALDQPAAGNAAANLYFVAKWAEVVALGERGYRAVQLEAGILSGQIYLASTALGLRASGLTFYDDEVTRLFALGPDEWLVLMLVVFGAPYRGQ